MPEANVLYTVTAVVIAGLVLWVLASLKMAKQPWPRPEAVAAIAASKSTKRDADVPVEKPADESKAEEKADAEVEAEAEAEAEEKKEDEEKTSEA